MIGWWELFCGIGYSEVWTIVENLRFFRYCRDMREIVDTRREMVRNLPQVDLSVRVLLCLEHACGKVRR